MKNKKRNNKSKSLLVLLLLGLTVGFALLTATLTINGNGKINKATWNIHWDNIEVKKGSVQASTPAYIVDNKKTIVEYSVTFEQPGDFYEFTVDAVNDGTIDGQVSVVSNEILDANDEVITPSYITSSVTYSDGQIIEPNNLLKVGRREKYKVRVSYDPDINNLLADDTEFKFRFSVTYVQSDTSGSIRDGICNASIYDEYDVTESRYLDLCESYIDEDIYTYDTNDDDTITITGFKDGYTIQQVKSGVRDLKASKLINDVEIKAKKVDNKVISFKDGVWAIPLTIGGKKVTNISGDAFNDKSITAELVLPPTLLEIEDGSSSPDTVGAFCNNNITAIGLNRRITNIGDYAFAFNKLTSLKLTDKIERVGIGSFKDISTLISVKLNDKLELIDEGAFYKTSITSIKFPEGLKTIETGAFNETKLTKVVIPDSVTTLKSGTFGTSTLEEIYTGDGLTSLQPGVFDMTNVTKLVVGDAVTTVGVSATPKLVDLKLGNSVQTITDGSFMNCQIDTLDESVLGSSVTTIMNGSFSSASIKKIHLPNNVTTVQYGAFSNTLAEEIDTGDGLTAMNSGTFNASQVKKLRVGNSVKLIDALGSTANLEELDLGNSVETITNGSFYGGKLKKIVIPDSVTTLNNGSFSGFDLLEEVDVGDGVTYLGTGIFGNYREKVGGEWIYHNSVDNLKKIRFGNSVQTISDGLFSGALKLEEIDWGNGNNQITIQSGAMNSIGIERLVLPDNVIAVTSGALNGTKAKYIDTGNGLKVIQSGTFSNNSSLETLVIGDSVEEIQSAPFYGIPTLTNVTFGSSLKTISAGVFQNSGLTSVDLSNSKVETIGNMAFINNNISSVDLGDHIVTIGPEAFSTNNITSVVFPSTTRTIGDWSFAYNNISSITVPEGVTYLSGFRENNISELTIPSTVTELGRDAFNDNNISSVTLPNGLITIGALSLGKNNLTSITIPNTVTTIGDAAFYANKLTDYTIPSSVLNIGGGVFVGNQITDPNKMFTYVMNDGVYDYTTLASYNGRGGTVTIPSGVTKLANFAFFNTYITGIQGVENITEFGEHTFSWTELESFTIPNAVTTIPHSLFYGAKLKHVTLHNNIDTISHSAFLRTDLEEVTIPDSVTTIGYDAFRDTKLTTVTIPASVTRIEGNAFSGCNLSTVYFYPSDGANTSMGYPTFYKGRKRDKEKYDYANSNPNLTEIHNIGGMQHHWGKIVAGDSAPYNSITSGTLTTDLGNISLTTN